MEVVYQIYGQSNIENADLTAQTRDRLGSRHKHNNIYIYVYTVQTYILDTDDTCLIIINDLSSLSYRHSCTDRETHTQLCRLSSCTSCTNGPPTSADHPVAFALAISWVPGSTANLQRNSDKITLPGCAKGN